MIRSLRLFALALPLFGLISPLRGADANYRPELFKSLHLVYQDSFDGTTLPPDFWEIRQSSTWVVKDGVLTGSPAPKEFQDKMIAKGDRGHAGLKPVIWLKKVPENFVCELRIRYDGEAYQRGFPLLDLGHHIHTLTFSEKATTLAIKKNVETLPVAEPLFPLNRWLDVVIELKKGAILLKIDGKRHLFESANIDMTGHSQIDFKGLDFGACQIDHIRVWEGRDAATTARYHAMSLSAVAGAATAAGCTFTAKTLHEALEELTTGVSPAAGQFKGRTFRCVAPASGTPDRLLVEAHLRWIDGRLEYVPAADLSR